MTFELDATRGYLQLGPTRLSYLDWGGAGRPALLLHGITSSAATLWQLAPALKTAGYRPIALDMPGHGESDISQDHAIDTLAGLAGAALEALGLQHVLVLGHSWGGATALALASGATHASGRISRTVLVDPALAMTATWGEERLPNYLEGLGEPASTGAVRVRANNPSWAEADIFWKAIALEQCRREQVAGFFLPSEEWSLVERFGQLQAPLLLLVADPVYSVIPPERLNEVRRTLSPALGTVTVLHGTTHNMFRGPGYSASLAALLAWLRA